MERLLEKQGWHLLALFVLLAGVCAVWQIDGMQAGSLWSISTQVWFVIAVAVPVVHQVFVALAWRLQLDTQWLTKTSPRYGFTIYLVVFMIMLVGRLAAVVLLSVANQGSLPGVRVVYIIAAGVLSVPVVYVFYSIARYFGVKRAAGADHFDEAYRRMPLVNEGIFKYTGNAMYLYGMLILYLPALVMGSAAGLLAAVFSHLYIWVHYVCTEKPDMVVIYGE